VEYRLTGFAFGAFMAKTDPTKDMEFHPDAWKRFERAAGVVAKSPPQHRVAKKKREASEPASRPSSRKKSGDDRKPK
jgi:hypothetical protein